MNVGAFAVVSHFANAARSTSRSTTTPGWAAARRCWPPMLTIFLLSLIGIPITGGFFAKFYVFQRSAEVEPGRTDDHWRDQQRDRRLLLPAHHRLHVHARTAARSARAAHSAGLGVSLAISLLATIYLGVLPGRVLDYAIESARVLTR